MHLGEEGSRNRTRATMRIMRLMLSLSILFHSAFAHNNSASPPSITDGPSFTSGGGTSSKLVQTQATVTVTMANNTAKITTAEPRVSTQTQPQSSTINNPLSSHISISGAPSSVPAATLSPSKATTPVATATTFATVATTVPFATVATSDSGGISVGHHNTLKASVASTNSRTEPSTSTYILTSPYHTVTFKIPKVSTYPTTEQTHSAITKTSEGDTEKTTVPVTTNLQIKSRTTETGKPGTTITHPTLTTGSLVPENLSETTLLQTSTATTTDPQPKIFLYSLNSRFEPQKEKDKELVEVCKQLMANFQDGNCTLIWRHKNGKVQFDCMEINGKVKTNIITKYYEEISKKPSDNKTLIAILASCGALLIMIFILAICASHHRRSYNENQQHLTEELHTVENGYHDNPTLEVMEVQPEMQEKKVALNGEFNNDSWIVPIDNLLKEDILDEEDTHL
ncbi:podocalyxin [Hippoglossus stenolepis]|uniref:podocalyxin n=1 Tax=Hippoglossus stenolepis TaxID=195615 RepID=UPI00159C4706|nr:podocalyxin [Hippoglossus stenolepis]